MTDKAKRIVEALRHTDCESTVCRTCEAHQYCNGYLDYAAADLIESLCAELEATETIAALARGLECERDQLKARLEHVEFERDAAVEDLRGACAFCAHARDCLVTGCSRDMGEACKQCPCETCFHDSNWQWRGVQKEE